MAAVKAEHIFKKYKKVQALNGVSLEVGEGEIFGIIGPDGAGKTTCCEPALKNATGN